MFLHISRPRSNIHIQFFQSPYKMSTVTLQSSDEEIFPVDKTIAKKFKIVKSLLEDLGDEDDEVIPLPTVSSDILRRVIQWAEHHKNDPDHDDNQDKTPVDIPSWDADFLNVSLATLIDLNMAANYLDIKGLLALTVRKFANMITGKTEEELRKTFYIEDDLTSAEKAEIMKDNELCEM